jgi:superfamily II RNA helicase
MKEDTSLQKGKKKLNELLKRREDLISEMKKNPCWDCEHRSLYMTQQVYAKKLKDELDEIQKIIQGGTNEKEIEFNKRNEILTIYKIVDKDLNLLFKGKVAAKVTGADNILLTEFFFSGMINELSDVELLSVLSIFSCENRAKGDVPECSKVYSEKFTSTLNFIQKECDKLLQLETEYGIIDVGQQRINWKFYELVYEWGDQKPFSQLVHMSGIEEGMIVKMLMAVNRLLAVIESMA